MFRLVFCLWYISRNATTSVAIPPAATQGITEVGGSTGSDSRMAPIQKT